MEHLQQRHVIDDGPVWERHGVTQVAKVVAVAPQLLSQLGVADRRTGHVLIHRMRMLRQPRGQGPDMVQHLRQPLDLNASHSQAGEHNGGLKAATIWSVKFDKLICMISGGSEATAQVQHVLFVHKMPPRRGYCMTAIESSWYSTRVDERILKLMPLHKKQVGLGDEALRAHAVCPDELRRAGVTGHCRRKCSGAVAVEHEEQTLWQQAAQKAAVISGCIRFDSSNGSVSAIELLLAGLIINKAHERSHLRDPRAPRPLPLPKDCCTR